MAGEAVDQIEYTAARDRGPNSLS